jgi:hypothetical protein
LGATRGFEKPFVQDVLREQGRSANLKQACVGETRALSRPRTWENVHALRASTMRQLTVQAPKVSCTDDAPPGSVF